ncbi:MAG TPA: DUF2163 domain-containing protein [candidate division Zixibacteria bacterium]|nr:DUF2163 domain-containing protein [candidate division Zixibacteria bacterium]
MSKTIGTNLKDHLAANLSTLAVCWRILRQDGEEFFFTSHDVDLVIDGDTYEASSGMLPKSLSQKRDLSADNMEAMSYLDSEKITEADIEAGLFDYADVDIFFVNYSDLTQGKLYLVKGWKLGEVRIEDNDFFAEIRGKGQLLQQNVCDLFSPHCRADLGDSQCGVDLADSAMTFWADGSVTSAADRRTFTDTSRVEVTDVFRFGKLTFKDDSTGGANAGYSMEVKKYDPVTQTFTLFEKMPNDISVGDEYEVTYGCDKSRDTCRDVFDNVENFRGEPFVPGTDKLLEYY